MSETDPYRQRVTIFGEVIVTKDGTTFFPWTSDNSDGVGFKYVEADAPRTGQAIDLSLGRSFFYVAPVLDTPEGGDPTFYLYYGPYGDPRFDTRIGPFNLKGDNRP